MTIRYAEALEQQHEWLVDGLQQLYRRLRDGEGWPGGPVSLDHHGLPCSHELLTRLGALDESKGEHFEEDTGALQQRLWSARTIQVTVRSDNGLNPLNHSFCLPSLALSRQPPLPPACVAPASVWPPIQASFFPVDGEEVSTSMPNPMLGMPEIRNSPNADMGYKYPWGVDPVRHADASTAFLFEPQ